MANFSSRIFGTAISSLNAQQARIATLSNNIANAGNPNYAKRTTNLETRSTTGVGGLAVGAGVEVSSVTRTVDNFLEGILQSSHGDYQKAKAEGEFMKRLEGLFGLTAEGTSIGSALNQFFAAADDLSVDPSSIELRQNLIERSNDLVNTIKYTYNSISSLQVEANQRIATEVTSINGLTQQIAGLNSQISARESSGSVAADERDQRDGLLNKLAEKIGFDTLEMSDGSITITLPSGFALVNGGTSRSLEVTSTPSFATGGAQMLNSSQPNYVVFNYGTTAAPAHVDLSAQIASGGGSLSGYINTRGVFKATDTNALQVGGPLVDIASRIEALSVSLLTDVNTTYLGPDRDGGTAGHQSSAGDLDGNNPAVFGLFKATGVSDADADGVPTIADLIASGRQSFSSVLSVTITDPRAVAAARDSGTGVPAAAVYQAGDGRNMIAIAGMQNTAIAQSSGNFSATITYDENFNQLVAKVGNYTSQNKLDVNVSEANLVTAQNNRDEISGVSLDEEFSQLIQFQKAYEASARLLRVADTLLEQIVTII